MAEEAARLSIARHERGQSFSLEHPGRSLALELPSWKRLVSLEGVRQTFYHTCMFEGSRRRKWQVLVHNLPELECMGLTCRGYGHCDRTSLAHERRPVVTAGRVAQFITGEEREYPKGFCAAYASSLPRVRSFVEVYSGPNAPLSDQVSRRFLGHGVPGRGDSSGMREGQDLGHAAGLRAVSARGHSKGGDEPVVGPRAVNSKGPAWNDRVALGAGRQPKFGRREQLVPDGLNDPIKQVGPSLPRHRGVEVRPCGLLRVGAGHAPPGPRAPRTAQQDASVRARDLHLKSKAGVAARKLGLHMDLGLMERPSS